MAVTTTASTTGTSAADIYASLNGQSSDKTSAADNGTANADRFLKLLVAQMRNQDPLNPMDNAQVTTQLAQINTVEGITTLNTTVSGLNTQFAQLQALQAAALIGKDVSVNGDALAVSGTGASAVGSGGYELAGDASAVKVEVLNASGRVIAMQELGPQTAGRQSFVWKGGTLADQDDLRFRITATRGATSVSAQPLTFDRVLGVSTSGGKLSLELENSGSVDYAAVKAVRQGG